MDNDMNFEFELKKRFDEEAPKLPESLKKEKVIEMLEKNKKIAPVKKKKIFPKVLATAAALIVVVSAIYVMPIIKPNKSLVDATTQPPLTTQAVMPSQQNESAKPEKEYYNVIDNGLAATKLQQAESADELRNHFIKIYRENQIDDFVDGVFDVMGSVKDEAIIEDYDVYNGAASENMAPQMNAAPTTVATVVDKNAANMSGGTGDDAHGTTNTQVENVDEADIIKNDGRYLYILSGGVYSAPRKVTIVDAKDMKVVSTIEIEDESYNFNIQEMYVNGDRLVLLATQYEKNESDNKKNNVVFDTMYGYNYYNQGEIASFVYDISDRANPAFVRKVVQDGSEYISSRMIDGVLYTVSNYAVRGNSESDVKDKAIPDVNGEEIACGCIYIYDYDSKIYTVVSAYDTRKDDAEVSSLSILGAGSEIYCSEDALYVACYNYDYDKGDYTDIYSFSLDGANIAYKASGTVKGSFLNQFSFDEYQGNLRVATTYYSYKHDVDVSNIYVLNKNLELIGSLEDIAYDEQVKSVRFMGDTGFIVTFRNTDPLFTLDLSDPTAPKAVGEVKLPGFSSYLHPVGDGLVVGLGYDGDEENADFSSLKLSLFDVSDMKNPKEVDTFVLKNVTSAAQYNHKAFIYYPEENLIGFPVEHYENGTVLSYKLLRIENGKIESHLGYVHKTERLTGDVFRGTYIGDKLYTIDNFNVCEFEIDTAVMIRECEILNVDDDMPEEDKNEVAVTSPAVMPGGVVETTVASNDDTVSNGVTGSIINDIITTTGASTTSNGVTEEKKTTLPPDYVTTTTASAVAVTMSTTQSINYTFTAKVIEAYSDNGLLVEITEQGNSSIPVGSQVELSSTGMVAVSEGDEVIVTFDGTVLETYPYRITNVFSVEKL